MTSLHLKCKRGDLVLLRRLDPNGKVFTIWGGRVLASASQELTVLAIEMVCQGENWHCVGEFREVKAPPDRQAYQWDFPRLLIKFEANDIDLKSRPVLEAALALYDQAQKNAG